VAIVVTDQPTAERYEVHVDGELAGFAEYRSRPGLVAFVHTEIEPRFEGRGLGSRVIAEALDDARRRHLAVLPFCPFVNAYLHRHPEYADLVPPDYRTHFEL